MVVRVLGSLLEVRVNLKSGKAVVVLKMAVHRMLDLGGLLRDPIGRKNHTKATQTGDRAGYTTILKVGDSIQKPNTLPVRESGEQCRFFPILDGRGLYRICLADYPCYMVSCVGVWTVSSSRELQLTSFRGRDFSSFLLLSLEVEVEVEFVPIVSTRKARPTPP